MSSSQARPTRARSQPSSDPRVAGAHPGRPATQASPSSTSPVAPMVAGFPLLRLKAWRSMTAAALPNVWLMYWSWTVSPASGGKFGGTCGMTKKLSTGMKVPLASSRSGDHLTMPWPTSEGLGVRSRSTAGGCFELGHVDLDHLQHRGDHAVRDLRIGVAHQALQLDGNHLPAEPEPVRQPSAPVRPNLSDSHPHG